MGFLHWLGQNWFPFIQSAGIIGSLLFSGVSARNLREEERTTNLLEIKRQHDDLWQAVFESPRLARLLDPQANLKTKPVTREEELFVILAVAHLSTAHRVLLKRMSEPSEALRQDIRWFFSLPIPKTVWEKTRSRYDAAFVELVEACRTA
jgi:hypothetical protein